MSQEKGRRGYSSYYSFKELLFSVYKKVIRLLRTVEEEKRGKISNRRTKTKVRPLRKFKNLWGN